MELTGYRPREALGADARRTLWRAVREADGVPVLLKRAPSSPPTPLEAAALRREAEVRTQVRGPVLPAVLATFPGALVLEDPGGQPLKGLLAHGPLSLERFLPLARRLAALVDDLHQQGFIHRGLTLDALLAGEGPGALALVDWSSASRLAGEAAPATSAPALGPPLSPEQTGRVNRGVDHRTDFYALGAIFYQLLTGRPPFESADPLELAHWHIARKPVPPSQLDPRVPSFLSQVTLKLLAKMAEDRYQSARGLLGDLERFDPRARGQVAGSEDGVERLALPQRLVGRDRELQALEAELARAAEGEARVALVGGAPGVGKTALLSELGKAADARQGRFGVGKHDQLERGRPHAALGQAVGALCRAVAEELPGTRLQALRAGLRETLGATAGALLALGPEVEAVTGPLQPPPPLGPTETQHRLVWALEQLLEALAGAGRPLVLLLDDLQWAEAATLRVLEGLVEQAPGLPVLWLLAFREAELPPEHPVRRLQAALREKGPRPLELTLGPLKAAQLEALVLEALGGDGELAAALAPVLLEKTQGNPYFVRQFLVSLERQGLLVHEPQARRWRCELDRIADADLTDNVVELLTRRLTHLPPATREALAVAAFLGGELTLGTLALLRRAPPAAVAADLWEGIAAGLLRPLDPEYELKVAAEALEAEALAYRFAHDRVQQAAYELTPAPARAALHLEVGRLLRASPGGEGERLFETVDHLDRGRHLLTDEPERREVAALNLAAGRRARAAGAVQTALGYLEVGQGLLPPTETGALRWELALQLAEAQVVCGQEAVGQRGLEAVAAGAPSEDLRAEARRLRIVQAEDAGRFGESVALGLEALAREGAPVPAAAAEREAALEAALAEVRRRLEDTPLEALAELPEATDAGARRESALLVALWPSAFLVNEPHLTALLSARLVLGTLEHGRTEGSAIGLITHAITVTARTGDYRSGAEYGRAGLALLARAADPRQEAKALHLYGSFLACWAEPLPQGRRHGHAAHRTGLATGDFTYAGRAAFMETWYLLFPGAPLAEVVARTGEAEAFLERIGHGAIQQATRVLRQYARALQGQTRGPTSLDGDGFEEAAFLRTFAQVPIFRGFLGVARTGLLLLHREPRAAWEASLQAQEAFSGSAEQLWHSVLDFYQGLAAAAVCREVPPASAALEAAIERLGRRALGCPTNFEHQHLLLRAERARALGDLGEAVALYAQATLAAERAGFPNDQGLVAERRARFEAERGEAGAARAHLAEAAEHYRRWGATTVAQALEAERPAAEAPALAASFDAASALKAARAIAEEIELPRLLPRLLKVVLENAGADRGVLVEAGPAGLTVLAEERVSGEAPAVALPVPLAGYPALPRALVEEVHRTGAAVVLADARGPGRWQAEADLQRRRPRSVLCAPVLRQGAVRGVLYLENSLTTEVFTPARAGVVEVLAAQAAISLENARLYQDLQALKNRLQAENVYLQEEIRTQQGFDELVGTSPQLQEALKKVEKVAPTESTVLVLGETGTGKELVARAIHQRSRRKDRALVKVNCAAIASGLVESELFGHAKGAFTGALQKRVGRFELADGGTLFLDEVGELPLDTQAKLLRVLQEQEFEPVGSSRTQRVDVRVIAATNRDLKEAVKAGRFREDLLYRLDVFPIQLPPLRQRRGDLPLLAAFFLERVARRLGTPLRPFGAGDLERLAAWPWPGNVRELQNVVERAAILARDGVPNLEAALPSAVVAEAAAEAAGVAGPASAPVSESIEDVERAHIVGVLRRTGWVVEGTKGAASILQLHPNTLRSRMKRLGIVREDG